MGVLQSCEAQDKSMRVSLDEGLFKQTEKVKYSSDDYYFRDSKLRLFGDIYYKKAQGKTEFVVQTNFTNRNTNVLNHAIKIYEDSNSFMLEKGYKIKIINAIDDPNILGSKNYLIKIQGKTCEQLMKIVPFNRYEQQKYKKGIYEAAMLNKNVGEENDRYGFAFQQVFVIQSGIDKDSNDKCLVIIGDYVTASLDEVINFRKMSQLPWSQHQFETLCYQLIKGIHQIHLRGLAHREIRPSNIFYSPVKKSFVIGGFHNSILMQKDTFKAGNSGYNLSGVPYYLPPYLIEVGKREQFSEYYNYQPFHNDIYALGVTLLNCLFLDQFMPPQILAESLKKYYQKYNFLKLVRQMMTENPPKLQQVLQTLSDGQKVLDQKTNIESLRYKMKPQDEQFVNRKKLIANGYYEMFMYDHWVEEINEVVSYYELNRNQLMLADVYKQIGDIYSEHGQQQMMIEYYDKASKTFLDISVECLEESKNEEAIKNLEKGINCNRKGYRDQPNHDLAHLLNKLALVYHRKAQYEYARAFQEQSLEIVGKVYGQNSAEYAEMLIDSAKIQSEFQEFKLAENMLKAGLKIIEKKDQTLVSNMKTKARLLESLGNNYRMKALERRDKSQNYRRKAEDSLLDSLQLSQKIEGNINPLVGSVLMNLGNVYFDKRQFDKAKKSYEKSLIVKQHTLKNKYHVQVGECLTYLANSEKFLRQYDSSTKHYDEAIEVFRRAYGNDHNENTAVAIGNLGLVYKELGNRKEMAEYLTLAKGILKDLYGEQCPDYQYFDRQLSS